MSESRNKEFLVLYEPIHHQLSGFCRVLTGNTDEAKDLLNDTVLNTITGFESIKDKKAFKSYTFKIASNVHKIKARRNKFSADYVEEKAELIIDHSQNPEYAAEFQLLYEKLMTLPGKTKEALILFHISDLSINDIQKIQGGSISAVKLRLKRGKERLRSMISSRQDQEVSNIFLSL
ncbi:MAG: RNA polymerase sigma-70 factor (ECF subfamily) [Cyclobacteriaceae bacterium]|jgi:RNA polymerase sigma-70 factor (ECF subfamily)